MGCCIRDRESLSSFGFVLGSFLARFVDSKQLLRFVFVFFHPGGGVLEARAPRLAPGQGAASPHGRGKNPLPQKRVRARRKAAQIRQETARLSFALPGVFASLGETIDFSTFPIDRCLTRLCRAALQFATSLTTILFSYTFRVRWLTLAAIAALGRLPRAKPSIQPGFRGRHTSADTVISVADRNETVATRLPVGLIYFSRCVFLTLDGLAGAAWEAWAENRVNSAHSADAPGSDALPGQRTPAVRQQSKKWRGSGEFQGCAQSTW